MSNRLIPRPAHGAVGFVNEAVWEVCTSSPC